MYQKRNNCLEVVALFLSDYAKQLYLREISKLSKIPLKTTQNILSILDKEKILKSSISGKNKYFRLNLDNIQAKFYILQAEIYQTQIFIEKYPLFKIFLSEINANITLIIFGSFAKSKADKDSDVDLAIISKEMRSLPFHLLPYKIHQIEFSEASYTKALEKQETLIKEIGANHIILSNHSFYVNEMWCYYGKQRS